MKLFKLACLCTLVLFGILFFIEPPTEQNQLLTPEDGPATGAKLALDYVSLARSYPNFTIPDQGFAQAFEEVQVSNERAKAKGFVNPDWTAMGPINIGGRTLALAIHPDTPDIMFAGSASGGIWKTTSAGVGLNAWEYVSTGFPVLGVAAIAMDPQNPDVMYIGTGESYGTETLMPGVGPVRTTRGSYGIGILRTEDGGETWEKSLDWTVDQRRAVQKIQVNPQNSLSVWAATTEGTYRTLDGGETWELIHNVAMATDIAINPVDTTKVFITNGGQGSIGHGVYRTINGGESFEQVSLSSFGGPISFQGKPVLDMSRSDPDVVVVSIGNSNGAIGAVEEANKTWLMRTEDGGSTWTTEFESNDFYARFQGWYSHAVAIHPTNPDLIWATGQPELLYRSTNGGSNMDTVFANPAQPAGPNDFGDLYPFLSNWADHHDIVFHPQNSNIIYFINDGGIFRTTDGGTTLENCNSGYQTVQFYNGVSNSNTNGSLMLGGLQDNNSIIYEGDLNWRRGWAGDGAWTALNQDNNNIAYLSAQFAQAVKTDDLFTQSQFGDTWARPSFELFPTSEANFIAPFVLSPVDNTTMYMGGERIYKSEDGGDSWFATNSNLNLDGNSMSAMAASHQSVDVVYATSSPKVTRSGVYRTINGGDTWINITNDLPDRFPTDIVVDPNNDEIVYITFAGFESSHLFKSIDGGANWIDIGGGLPDLPTWAVTVDPQFPDHIFVGNEIGVFQSLDGGETWENINGNLPDAVFAMDLVISQSNRMLRVATHGNGAYEMNLPQGSPNEPEYDFPGAIRLGNNYPNPFNPSTIIPYELKQQGQVSLKVYDVNGRLVQTLVDRVQGAGEFYVSFEASELPSGTYFYQLRAGGEVEIGRMLLVK
ncbi:MAG: T9SS C-terminal target domain-containing protein [Balneola sp.]|nr:MAG: T9SS C-terminal target domain-containing protein [Balneola sp.]